jgi:hypothetical protein
MAHSVYYVGRDLELNLSLDDLGHPNLPDLWDEIYPSKKLPPNQLQCLQCLSERGPDCPEFMYLRVREGRRQAVHHNTNIKDHATAPESATHKALKERIAGVAERAGFKVQVEDLAFHRKRRTDVLIHGADGFRLGCEAQISRITAATVLKRTRIAEQDNITPMWTTNDPYASLIDRAPWARIDKKPWQDISNGAELPVRGGVRTLVMVRCDRLREVYPDKKLRRSCRGWHPRWNARWTSLDKLIVGAAAQQDVPLQYLPAPNARKAYWYWVSAEDREQYLNHIGGPAPVGAQTPATVGDEEGAVEVDPKEVSRVCTYGQNSFVPTSKGPRDSGAVITGVSVDLGHAARRPTLTAPLHSPIRRGYCNAGVTPCGAPARLYACGWRCEQHKP